jgi:putative ABC transport system permease protein
MDLNIRPIFSAVLRNLTGTALVVLQVGIALAVLVNATWIVHQRIQIMNKPTGMDDSNMLAAMSVSFTKRFNYDASLRTDLAYLRGLNGVVAAAPSDAVPFSHGGSTADVWTNPDQKGPAQWINTFSTDEQGLKAFGAHLVAGREFRAEEILPPVTEQNVTEFVPSVIVTQAIADTLFPGQNALGKTIYDSVGKPATIIGIMSNMIGTAPQGVDKADHVALVPRLPALHGVVYLVRTEPGRRDQILPIVEEHLSSSNPDRVIKWVRPVERYKKRLYLSDHNMKIFLITVTLLVLTTTSLGIFGLSTFNVSSRTKQIGTRRALGARKLDILQYFMVENALVTAAGIVLGCVLAVGMGYWLSLEYKLPRLNLYYLVGGVLALWGIGQLAVWQPARRASSVSPSVATRTV